MNKSRCTDTYEYFDPDGRRLLKKRYEEENEHGEIQKRASWHHLSKDGTSQRGMDGAKPLPFRSEALTSVARTVPIFVAEGEKCVRALEGEEFSALCGPHGSAWQQDHAEVLRGRPAIVLPDNDAAGYKYGQAAAASLHGVAASVKVVELPGLGDGEDVADWFQREGNDRDEFLRLAVCTPEWEPECDTDNVESAGRTDGGATHATRLAEIAADFELFHHGDDAYASIERDGHRETYPIRSKALSGMLRQRYFVLYQAAPSSQALNDALGVIEGTALYGDQTQEHAVYMRVAEMDGTSYLDLGGPNWNVVKISGDGWEVLPYSPVRFVRSPSMRALPVPMRGGTVDDLRPLVNVASDDDFRLIVGFGLCALRASGPHFVLGLHGEQGSSKSTLSAVLKGVIDPNQVPIRAAPRDENELAIMASKAQLLALDNISALSGALSDALCRLTSGGGVSKRKLYTDMDEVILDVNRPVILNGINEVATRPDLLDRSINIHLPRIPQDRRQDEKGFWSRFESVRAAILGALLDAVSGALRELPHTTVDKPPRMADCVLWVTAAESALVWEHGSFLRAYRANMVESNETALEASPVTEPLRTLLETSETGEWTGTMEELLGKLRVIAAGQTAGGNALPKNGRGLSMALERIEPNLRADGITVSRSPRTKARREVIIRRETSGRN